MPTLFAMMGEAVNVVRQKLHQPPIARRSMPMDSLEIESSKNERSSKARNGGHRVEFRCCYGGGNDGRLDSPRSMPYCRQSFLFAASLSLFLLVVVLSVCVVALYVAIGCCCCVVFSLRHLFRLLLFLNPPLVSSSEFIVIFCAQVCSWLQLLLLQFSVTLFSDYHDRAEKIVLLRRFCIVPTSVGAYDQEKARGARERRGEGDLRIDDQQRWLARGDEEGEWQGEGGARGGGMLHGSKGEEYGHDVVVQSAVSRHFFEI